jgi:hypothetical protein
LSINRAASDRAWRRALPCGSPDWPGGPEWQWFTSPKPHPGLHAPATVVVVDGTVVVVDAPVVVVDGWVVDVVVVGAVVVLVDVVVGAVVLVLLDVVVVGGIVVDVVVLDVVVVGGIVVDVVVLDVVVVGGIVVDVVVLDVVVVGGIVVEVVVLDVVLDVVVLDVELVVLLEEVVDGVTGMVIRMSVGTLHVTAALRTPFNCTAVVSDTMLIVTDPEAGAVAWTLMSGVVSVAVSGSPGLPAAKGPGCPYLIWFAAGNDALFVIDVDTGAHWAGLVAGS